MNVIYGILFITAFIGFISPFVVWTWTNFNKAQEVFGVLRLKFIMWTWLIGWIVFIIDISIMLMILFI